MALINNNSILVQSNPSHLIRDRFPSYRKKEQPHRHASTLAGKSVAPIRVREEQDLGLTLLSKTMSVANPTMQGLEKAFLQVQDDVGNLCKSYGAQGTIVPTFLDMKALAALWSLEGTVHETTNKSRVPVPLEEVTLAQTLLLFRDQVLFFLKTSHASSLTFHERLILQNTIENIALGSLGTSQEKKERIKEGLPLFLLKGFSEQSHAVGFIVHHNRLFICNRGYGATSYAITCYTIRPELIDEAFFSQLGHESNADTLPILLKRIGAKRQAGIKQKFQKSNNCPWASTKSAFLALLYSLFKDTEENHETCLHRAKSLYKPFTAFSREQILKKYVFSSRPPNQELLKKIERKLLTSHRLSPAISASLLRAVREKIPEDALPF